jgi:SecD/SecF fusion protein
MKRAPLLRAVLALTIIATSLFIALTSSARLGLDLRGGTQIGLETKSTDTVKANAESTDRALQVLRNRIDALGVTDPTITRSGDRRIIIELPGVQDPREAAALIGRTAQLTFHPVVASVAPATKPTLAQDQQVIPDETGQQIVIGPAALTGEGVGDADAGNDPQRGGNWFVTVDFRGAGGDAWRTLTGKAACAPAGDSARRVAIVLDREVISSPQVDESIGCNVGISGGSTQITGQFTPTEAKDLSVLIKGGALPVPVDVIEQRTVGPTLGADAIDASIEAALIGLALTGLFITVVYRLVGLLATVALGCYALISYAALVALGATLTLPGLAGFVLAIGMAIDANVLVFERAREEFGQRPEKRRPGQRPKGLSASLRTGFDKAWSAILDSNMTTLLAAGLLFLLASGPVRGFGVTLSVGVLASMISALVIARVFTEWAVRRSFVNAHPRFSGLAGNGRLRGWLAERGPDLIRRGRLWLAISASVVVLAVAGMLVRGLNLGVEFTGGRLLSFTTSQPVSVERARAAISDAGFPQAVVQTSSVSGGASEDISVRTQQLTNDQAVTIERALATVGGDVSKQRDELIGPSLGAELRTKALIALGAALVAQLIYLAFRFRWNFGVAAALAMLHDVLAVVGLFAWLGKSIDGIFLAAALTIIGLSVNDTVVVFDRVRELRRSRPGEPFAAVVNAAVLQTVPRTVNTGLGAMFILGALTVFGGDSLQDFALALLIGLVVGTTSSVFIASPLAVLLERHWPAEPTAAPGTAAPIRRTADRYADIPTGRD